MDGNIRSRILKSGYVKEQAPYTKSELREIFQCNDDKLTHIIRQLRYKKLLKISKKDDNITDMSNMVDEVVDVRDAINDVSGYRYVFTCVGVIIIGGFVLKCYPKYIDDVTEEQDLLLKVKQVLKVLEKYNKNTNININMLSDNVGEKNFNLLEVILFLLHDYYENGIYINQHTIIESNGTGSILWDRTVNQIKPIIVKNRPYYTELLTRKRVDEEENYFRRLHECILTECSKIFSNHGLFRLFDDLSPVEFESCDLDDFGDIDYILYRLEREMCEQFNTRKQQLLKTMHAYIANKKGKYESYALSVYATITFHKIWEDVCAKVMQNKLRSTLKDLFVDNLGCLHPEYENSGNNRLIDIIDKPEWVGHSVVNYKEETRKKAKETLEPDVVSIFSFDEKKCFAIFDAKYYKIRFSDEQVSGQPGVGDVTKQYLYNLAYKDFIEKHNFDNVWNCFLMPIDGVEFIKRGYANMKILQFFNFGNGDKNKHYKDNIDIILMPASTMYDWYLSNKKLDDEFLSVIRLINSGEYGNSHKVTIR